MAKFSPGGAEENFFWGPGCFMAGHGNNIKNPAPAKPNNLFLAPAGGTFNPLLTKKHKRILFTKFVIVDKIRLFCAV